MRVLMEWMSEQYFVGCRMIFLVLVNKYLRLQQQIKQLGIHLMFQQQIIIQIEQAYPDVQINNTYRYRPLTQQLFAPKPNPQISIGDIRFVAEFVEETSQSEINQVVGKLYRYMTNLISTLQHNEACRLSWSEGVVRGRVQQESKISLKEYYREKSTLNSLIQQSKYGVTCKSEFTDLITRRRKQIFTWIDDSNRTKNIREIWLPEIPENYQHVELLTQDQYFFIYESFTQKVMTYQFAFQQYLSGRLPYRDLQEMCREMMRQDIVILNSSKANELIRYTWEFCTSQFYELSKLRRAIYDLRLALINSIIRTYYISFQAKKHIQQMNNVLNNIQIEVTGYDFSRKSSKNNINFGRNSVSQHNMVDRLVEVQSSFNNVFAYLTDNRETIFINLYERKLKKRVAILFAIDDRLTNIYKIQFNPDYAELQMSLRNREKAKNSREAGEIEKKFSQVRDLFEESKPINENKFRLVFQQLQRVALMVQKFSLSKEWQTRLANFQNNLINSFIFDKNGERKYKKEGPLERFSKSRVTNGSNRKGKVSNNLEAKKEEIFQETYEEFRKKNLSNSRAWQKEGINREQVYQEGMAYISEIKPEFGEQFMDLINFKVYLLPKLIQKAEAALAKTVYSDQPLFLQLTSLVQNLKLVSSVIRPEINAKKIDLIFYPRVNASLFTLLKRTLFEHQQKLKNEHSQLNTNAILNKSIQLNVQLFIQLRLKFLYFLLEDIDSLQKLAIAVSQLNLNKDNYDITSEATVNIILKLLLAEKELKAHQKAIRDKLGIKSANISQRALQLLCDQIYPSFINALSVLFENDQRATAPYTLQMLLDLSQDSLKFMEETNNYLDTILKLISERAGNNNRRNVSDFLNEFAISLRAYYNRGEYLVNESYRFVNINSDMIKRQQVRLQEFINISERGPNINYEIVDERAKKFINLLRLINN